MALMPVYGAVVHFFVAIGSVFYFIKMNTSKNWLLIFGRAPTMDGSGLF
jgi:hypothetical protein